MIADLNGYGKLDLAVPHSNPDAIGLLLGNGDGTFGPAIDLPTSIYGSRVVAADVNRDGLPDLVTDGVSVLLNYGQGAFGPPLVYNVCDLQGDGVAVADFTGDSWPDMAIANYAAGIVSVLVGRGDGTFGGKTDFGIPGGPDRRNRD